VITVAIPVLNEEATISVQLLKLRHFVNEEPKLLRKIKFVVVDNGSTDNTFQLAKNTTEDCEFIKVYSIPTKGVGSALKSAWFGSSDDYVGYMDLDFSTDLQHLVDVLDIIESNPNIDFIYGSRWSNTSKVSNRRKFRLVLSFVFNILVRRAFGLEYKDFMCGFKFLKRSLYQDIQNSFNLENNWFFCAEILIASQYIDKRAMVYELPVVWSDDLNSKVVVHRVIKMFLLSIAKFKLQIFSRTKKYDY
jgi:glycosyltransferase involved in cell wall biosynthesis